MFRASSDESAWRALDEATANSTTQPTSRSDSLDVRAKIKTHPRGPLNFFPHTLEDPCLVILDRDVQVQGGKRVAKK